MPLNVVACDGGMDAWADADMGQHTVWTSTWAGHEKLEIAMAIDHNMHKNNPAGDPVEGTGQGPTIQPQADGHAVRELRARRWNRDCGAGLDTA